MSGHANQTRKNQWQLVKMEAAKKQVNAPRAHIYFNGSYHNNLEVAQSNKPYCGFIFGYFIEHELPNMTIKFNGNFATRVTNFSSPAKIMSCTHSNSKESNRPKFFQNFIASVQKVCIFGGQIYVKCLTKYYTMKKLLLALLLIVLSACKSANENNEMIMDRADSPKIVTIDSCEYIIWHYGNITHKGDCKHCEQKRQKELEKLINALK